MAGFGNQGLGISARSLTVAALFFLSLPAFGQVCLPGELRVVVRDSQAAAVFEAQVSLDAQSGSTQPAALRNTETTGIADFRDIPCGVWTVRANKDGFDPVSGTAKIESAAAVEVALTLNPETNRTKVEVTEKLAPLVEQSASKNNELHPAEVRTLPTNPATVTDTLPLVPGIVRAPGGELKIEGTGEERSSLVVNQ